MTASSFARTGASRASSLSISAWRAVALAVPPVQVLAKTGDVSAGTDVAVSVAAETVGEREAESAVEFDEDVDADADTCAVDVGGCIEGSVEGDVEGDEPVVNDGVVD